MQLDYLHEPALMHNVHRASAIRTDVIPLLRSVLADSERAYLAGQARYLELRLAQRELLGAEAALLEESVAAHRNAVEIERLTGRALRG